MCATPDTLTEYNDRSCYNQFYPHEITKKATTILFDSQLVVRNETFYQLFKYRLFRVRLTSAFMGEVL